MKKARNGVVARSILCFLLASVSLVLGRPKLPAYQDGQVIPSLHGKPVSMGDVVVVWIPSLNEYVVKRVLGLGGDRIEIRDGRLFRNGTPLYERYVAEQGWAEGAEPVDVTVPEGMMFLLGDNRTVSLDSRSFGCAPVDDVFGVVLTR